MVSIITINYRTSAATQALLQSIALHAPDCEVIVVDNGVEKDQAHVFQGIVTRLIYIQSNINKGFAGGNNLGIKRATGDYLFFVNNDTVITSGLVQCLEEYLKTNEKVGGVSPKIVFFDQPDRIQYAGYSEMNGFTGRNQTIGQYDSVTLHTTTTDTAYLHGAAMMLPRKVVEKAGHMPEIYFLYYEELDWSCTIRREGFALKYHPCGTILHKESLSTGKDSVPKTYYHFRNRLLFMRRNYAGLQLFVFLCYYVLIAMPLNIMRHLFRLKLRNAGAILRAFTWNITHSVR